MIASTFFRWSFVPLCLAAVIPLRAQTSSELNRCASIVLASARLGCYDAIAKPAAGPSPASVGELAPGVKRLGGWIVTVKVDPITDQKGASFVLWAEGADRIDTPSLIIRCIRGKLEAYVSPDKYLGDRNTLVILRFGSEAPIAESWSESSDNTALFHPGRDPEIAAFVRKLSLYERLVIQVSPYNEAPMAMEFALAGIDQVNQELWSMCNPSK